MQKSTSLCKSSTAITFTTTLSSFNQFDRLKWFGCKDTNNKCHDNNKTSLKFLLVIPFLIKIHCHPSFWTKLCENIYCKHTYMWIKGVETWSTVFYCHCQQNAFTVWFILQICGLVITLLLLQIFGNMTQEQKCILLLWQKHLPHFILFFSVRRVYIF